MNRLIEKFSENDSAEEMNLLCIPYAGGGASVFFGWLKRLDPRIALYTVQLPGRENRIVDKPYSDIYDIIPDLMDEMEQLSDKPLVIFGHSMGAKIAYELEKALEAEGGGCEELIVSGSRAPFVPEPDPICDLPDKEFLHELHRFAGTPAEILKNEEMMKFFMPLLRADFSMDEKYCDMQRVKLSCPVTAFCGTEDNEAKEEDMLKWGEYSDTFSLKTFSGSHFFIKTETVKLFRTLNEICSKYSLIKEK